MDVGERWGHCSCCGKPSFHEFCNKCDGKAVQEDAPNIYCAVCEDEIVEVEGDSCEDCMIEAHDDNKCLDNCKFCDMERDAAEAMRDENR